MKNIRIQSEVVWRAPFFFILDGIYFVCVFRVVTASMRRSKNNFVELVLFAPCGSEELNSG